MRAVANIFRANVRGQGTRHLVTGTLDPLVRRFISVLSPTMTGLVFLL